jgi:sirohydrochlorin ferrochelatase
MPRAIIIVDHGSRREAANRMLDDVADMLRKQTSDLVYPAHMDLVSPSVEEAFDAAVAGGADFVYIFPYFLSPGRHSREDIPWMCAEAAREHPGVKWHVAGPIGLDPMIAQLILARVEHCEAQGFKCETCPNVEVCHPQGF